MSPRTVALVVGARPNFMKAAPLMRALAAPDSRLSPTLIHTGQHYDQAMSDIFFRELGLPEPDVFLNVGPGSHAEQTGRILIAIEPILSDLAPAACVVVGDVNSTLAGALAAVKLGIPAVHVEAGLRSFDRTMPEEINRLVTDAVCDLLLTSCRDAGENLRKEGIRDARIRFVGNLMIDSLVAMLDRTRSSRAIETRGLTPGAYVCVTLHRPSNVDDPTRLRSILDALLAAARDFPVVFPVHPRTRRRLESLGAIPGPGTGLLVEPPMGYLDFLRLQSQAAAVVTDSGGIQEETSFLGVPCITLRPNTERPITLSGGTNRLAEPDPVALPALIVDAAREGRRPRVIEGWDGHAADRIARHLHELFAADP